MLLENKNAVIYGGGGSVGGAVARAFAREGAKVFLAGRTLATLDRVADEITAAGGVAETARVDALDEQAVEEHIGRVIEATGRIDILFNAIGMQDVQDHREMLELHAKAKGKSLEEVLADFGSDTLLGRLPRVAEVADVATIMASDRASAMTGVIANTTCGSVVD